MRESKTPFPPLTDEQGTSRLECDELQKRLCMVRRSYFSVHDLRLIVNYNVPQSNALIIDVPRFKVMHVLGTFSP